jgi:hypothetical protein
MVKKRDSNPPGRRRNRWGGRNERGKSHPLAVGFRRLTLRSAMGPAQRAIPQITVGTSRCDVPAGASPLSASGVFKTLPTGDTKARAAAGAARHPYLESLVTTSALKEGKKVLALFSRPG